MLQKLKLILRDGGLRKRILFVLMVFAIFRGVAAVPIPGVNLEQLKAFFAGNQFFGLLNIISGGAMSNLSIVMLGVAPYITASIIMQLLTMIFPSLKAIYHEEGEAGRKKFSQYSRILSLPLALLQSYGFLSLLANQGVLSNITFADKIENALIIAAGSVFLMWLGELISEYGIGNGISLLIFAGILAGIPQAMQQTFFQFNYSDFPILVGLIIAGALIIAGVVLITEAERPVPISYAKRIRGMKVYGGVSTYLPLRVNQAGVIPIIFAVSILLFPQMIAGALSAANVAILNKISSAMLSFLNNSLIYGISYFVLVFLFTYFYTAVTFDPESISSNLQKSGAFVPGIRPGQATANFLYRIISRITLTGAMFLSIIAVLPLVIKAATGFSALAIGGTALLIAVSVVLETVRQVQAQISMREYE